MNYRVEDILAWFIPGFYTLMWIGVIVGLIHADNIQNLFACCQDNCGCNPNGFKILLKLIKDSLPLLLFILPVTAMILGWMINALGGCLYRRCPLNYPIVKSFDKVIKNGSYSESGVVYSKSSDYRDKVRLYKEYARLSIDLKEVDRFYYRYVLSRNMVASQLCMIVALLFLRNIPADGHIRCCWLGCCILLLGIYIAITYRDLTTHSKYVWKVFLCGNS